jgi:hypothetical protein
MNSKQCEVSTHSFWKEAQKLSVLLMEEATTCETFELILNSSILEMYWKNSLVDIQLIRQDSYCQFASY